MERMLLKTLKTRSFKSDPSFGLFFMVAQNVCLDKESYSTLLLSIQAPAVQRADNFIQQISRYPMDKLYGVHFIRWVAIYPLDI